MDATRRSIAGFAAGILVSLVARSWYVWSLPRRDAVLHGGLTLGAILWRLGAYYGYEAIRTGSAT